MASSSSAARDRDREGIAGWPSTPSHFLSRQLLAQAPLPLAPSLTTNHTGAGAASLTSDATVAAPTTESSRLRSTSNAATIAALDHAVAFEVCDVHPTFSAHAERRGDVLVRARATPRQNPNQYTASSPSRPVSPTEYVDFYCHGDVLWFASPFFRTLLQGKWRETTGAVDTAPVDRTSRRRSVFDEYREREASPAPVGETDGKGEGAEAIDDQSPFELPHATTSSARGSFHTASFSLESGSPFEDGYSWEQARQQDRGMMDLLEGRRDMQDWTPSQRMARLATPPLPSSPQPIAAGPGHALAHSRPSSLRSTSLSRPFTASRPRKRQSQRVRARAGRDGKRSSDGSHSLSRPKVGSADDSGKRWASSPSEPLSAVIELPDEDASTVEGALRHVYPHLDLTVTWRNCARLLAFADKYDICGLRRVCVDFLRASLAGRPVLALKIADDARLKDIYKESSRHVMDAWPNLDPAELATLSPETLLKLERKRTWFLERLLKLGLATPGRDFLCQPNCPDPDQCARTLQERWQNALSASFRFGPPTPSAVWRHLRELEGVAPIGSRELAACHNASKAWTCLLFDRMFNLPSGLAAGHPKFLTIKLE